jgi:hypothetical protein
VAIAVPKIALMMRVSGQPGNAPKLSMLCTIGTRVNSISSALLLLVRTQPKVSGAVTLCIRSCATSSGKPVTALAVAAKSRRRWRRMISLSRRVLFCHPDKLRVCRNAIQRAVGMAAVVRHLKPTWPRVK